MPAWFRPGARSPARFGARSLGRRCPRATGAEAGMSDREAALYARVSTDQHARDNTIASQLAALRERVAAEGDRVTPDHAYVDEGYSGAGLVRPALERLRDAIAAGPP